MVFFYYYLFVCLGIIDNHLKAGSIFEAFFITLKCVLKLFLNFCIELYESWALEKVAALIFLSIFFSWFELNLMFARNRYISQVPKI